MAPGGRVEAARFRAAMSRFLSGVTVVSVFDRAAGRPHGLTVSAFLSVSLDPTLVLVSLAKDSRGLECIGQEGRFGVNILGEHQERLALHFARRSHVPVDPPFVERDGVPLLAGSLVHLVVRTVEIHPAGDHALCIGLVEDLEYEEGWPLAYFRSRFYRLVPQEVLDRIAGHFL